jgi:8-oxo-dGTP diphosphatase
MSDPHLPVFGTKHDGCEYVVRPSAYALLRDDAGAIAVVRTPKGHFLLGGGIERGESPAEAVRREAREEAGLVLDTGETVCRAVELTRSLDEPAWYEKVNTFVAARVTGRCDAVEPDHELRWLPVERALDALTPPSHRWAVARFSEPR